MGKSSQNPPEPIQNHAFSMIFMDFPFDFHGFHGRSPSRPSAQARSICLTSSTPMEALRWAKCPATAALARASSTRCSSRSRACEREAQQLCTTVKNS